jgi:uncharacterized protein YecE (DUF72 family)
MRTTCRPSSGRCRRSPNAPATTGPTAPPTARARATTLPDADRPRGRLYAGTSGFAYPGWIPRFYPSGLKAAGFLASYAERLGAVELNNTFYRLPAEEQFRRWAEATPEDFRFAVKAPRAISFFGRLDQLGTLAERLAALGPRLGPLLVRARDDRPRDDGFLQLLLESLDPSFLVALDLRHPTWDGVEPGLPRNAVRVNQLDGDASFRYLRFSDHPYDDAELARAAETVRSLGVETYCLFARGEAEDHSPAGEPTAVTAERFARFL